MTTKEIVTKIKELVAIPSTVNSPEDLRRAVEFMDQFVQDRVGVTVERFEHNGSPSFLAYRGAIRPEKFDILLNAHVDVVPAAPEQFNVLEKDGKLYGRGVLDMKGTAIVLADVFCELVNEVPYSLGLQIVSDEEVGGYAGVKYQIEQGVRANFVVVGEYANDRNTIYNAARGLAWAEIAFKGRSAHGAHLWNGGNAVVKAGEFAAAVLKRYPTPDKETWTTTASIANLSTPNQAYNRVPDSAVLKIDFRFTQEDAVFETEDSLRAFISSIDPNAELVNLATFEPAVNVEELNPYVQGLRKAVRSVSGKEPHFLGRPGGSDGRHYAVVNNDIVEFGLYGEHSHGDDEYVEVSSIGDYRATMRAFLHQPIPAGLQKEVTKLEPSVSKRNNKRPTYIWYATYGTGLSREDFLLQIRGGMSKALNDFYQGCTDRSNPLKDRFISLPYSLYFAGECSRHSGGIGALVPERDPKASTIARAYLITLEQFEELTAQMNSQTVKRLPIGAATRGGFAVIGGGHGDYSGLLYCGQKESFPVFSLTASSQRTPLTPPNVLYTQMLCEGLSQDKQITTQAAVEYLLHVPGIGKHYEAAELSDYFKVETPSVDKRQALV